MKTKTRTFIALFDVDHFDDARELAETIENQHFEVEMASGCEFASAYKVREEIVKELKLSEEDKEFVSVYPISDFMDASNSQEVNHEGTFMSYVTGTIKQ